MRSSLSEVIERIRALPSVWPNRGATLEEIQVVERRLGKPIPREFREYLRSMNGISDATPGERGWVELWPVVRWQTVGALGASSARHEAVVFADQLSRVVVVRI